MRLGKSRREIHAHRAHHSGGHHGGEHALLSRARSTRFHEEQLVERGRALGRLISLVSPEAILGFDYLLLNDYTREVSSQQDVVYGVIVNPQGMPISSYIKDSDPLIKKYAGAGKPQDISKLLEKLHGQPDLIQLDFPITHNNVLLGHFLVGISRESLQSQFRASW